MKLIAFATLTTLLLATSAWVSCEDKPDAGTNFTNSIDSTELSEGGSIPGAVGKPDETKCKTDEIFDGVKCIKKAPPVPLPEKKVKIKPPVIKEEPLPDVVKIDVPPYENPAEGITTPIRRKGEIEKQDKDKNKSWCYKNPNGCGALVYGGIMGALASIGAFVFKSVFWTVGLAIGGYFLASVLYDAWIKKEKKEGEEEVPFWPRIVTSASGAIVGFGVARLLAGWALTAWPTFVVLSLLGALGGWLIADHIQKTDNEIEKQRKKREEATAQQA